MRASTLLPILCVPLKTTTTSCSKVPQGLRFPLEVRGIFTTQYFQKVLARDSDHHVKPFMHVTIQMTRHYAHRVNLQIFRFEILNIAIKVGLYLTTTFFRKKVSRSSKNFYCSSSV